MPRLLAVDPSLTCSGWALFRLEGERLAAVGKIRALPAGIPMATRLCDLQSKIAGCFEQLELGDGDFLVCEAPTTMRDPRAAFVVEQVRGLFETLARTRSVAVPGRINPRTVHYEVMGLQGKQLAREHIKGIAVHVVETLYQQELRSIGFPTEPPLMRKHQDIIDAILIGNVALGRLRSARSTGLGAEEIFDAASSSGRMRARGR